jgi:ubiquitin-conjugating enzyme E2 W
MEKRFQQDLQALDKYPVEGVHVDADQISNNLAMWTVDVSGAAGTLYEGETFKLQFKFGSHYPFDSPEVVFLAPNIPLHPHVYSNGHICLSILTDDWSPALSVQSVCLSIVSMLSSCKDKKKPFDDTFYVQMSHDKPQKTGWWYHDDTV